MKKILFVQHATEIGGSLISLNNLIQGLKLKGLTDIEVMCKNSDVACWYQDKKVKAFHFPSIGFFGHCSGCIYRITRPEEVIGFLKQLIALPWFVFRQWKYFRNSDAHVIHLNSSVLTSSGIAAKLAGKKLVWHVREVMAPGNFGLRKKIFSAIIKRLSDKVVTISPFEAKKLGTNLKKNIEVVYNFIFFEHLKFLTDLEKAKEREKLKIPKEANLICSLGGFAQIKGTLEILQAFEQLDANYHLLILGDLYNWCNDERPSLKTKVKMWRNKKSIEYKEKCLKLIKGKENQIHVLGPKDSVLPYIMISDLLYFGGTIPHFPRPIFEAWSCKRPVLAFDNEVIREIVDVGINGEIVRIDPKDLARHLERMLKTKEELKKWGENGEKKAKELFNADTNVEKMITIYKELGVLS